MNFVVSQTRCFLKSEAGASYSLSIVLLIPFYVLLLAFFVETTNLQVTKSGLELATFAAARTASVVADAEYFDEANASADSRRNEAANEPLRLGMIHLAAVNTLAPFASGSRRHANLQNGTLQYPTQAPQDWANAQRSLGGNHDSEFLTRKWKYAANATRIEVERVNLGTGQRISAGSMSHVEPGELGLRVTVVYEVPFHTAGAGMLFGRKQSAGFYTYRMSSTYTIELERSKAEDARLPFRNFYPKHSFRSVNNATEHSVRGF